MIKLRREYFALLLLVLFIVACAHSNGDTTGSIQTQETAASEGSLSDNDNDVWQISISDLSGDELWSFTETELEYIFTNLMELPPAIPGSFTHIYSTVNNWPTIRFYAAEGYSVESILIAAGLYDAAQTVTFKSNDGYEISLTREQLFAPQYFYPEVNESDTGAEMVYPIIAYRWREGSKELSELRDSNPCLIFGQRNPFEHTNPAFVENVTEIIVSTETCDKWPLASTFPAEGAIISGETVKLQHQSYGLVKLHYTLDQSEPSMLSPMYNPSTYQPELNRPIPITEHTVIKVRVYGYGKADSDVAIFEFIPQD